MNIEKKKNIISEKNNSKLEIIEKSNLIDDKIIIPEEIKIVMNDKIDKIDFISNMYPSQIEILKHNNDIKQDNKNNEDDVNEESEDKEDRNKTTKRKKFKKKAFKKRNKKYKKKVESEKDNYNDVGVDVKNDADNNDKEDKKMEEVE